LVQRWRAGERPRADEFLDREPELWQRPEIAIELIYEEVCLRQEFGDEAAAADILLRFPQWRSRLEVLLDCQRLLEAQPPAPCFPAVGESVGGYRLVAQLGQGAQGRVFLAIQPSLADRPVVLKLTPRDDGHEHLSLARLQHTHIVPLYTAQEDVVRNLRILCMPYFGSTTLARLLLALPDRERKAYRGSDLLDALDRIQAAVSMTLPARSGARQLLARTTYVQAICWIGASLAEALQYAHERGLIHLDLKPSNVLLAADGQPLLLDFHLAREPLPAGGPPPEWLGGTPGYMSPEQIQALDALQQGRAIPTVVDGRSDLYSLGLLLYEALGGPLGGTSESPPALHQCNPHVSVGLSDVLQRCLAPNPHDRYADAAALAADLRRHLADLPLQGVANRSWRERWQKWRRRRPSALALAAMLLAVVIAAAGVAIATWSHFSRQRDAARTALLEGEKDLDQGRYVEAIDRLQEGLTMARDLPGSHDLAQELESRLQSAEQAQAHAEHTQVARELHLVADRLRFLYGVESMPAEAMRSLEARCRTFWERRAWITERLGAGLEAQVRQQVQDDLLDLVILWTGLRMHLAAAGAARTARREALGVLAEAETLFGPSPVLDLERRLHAQALGLNEAAAGGRSDREHAPRTAWEHYALGRSLLQGGDLTQAAAELERAADVQPHDLWPHFYYGLCAYRLGRHEDAVSAFTACVALAPRSGSCYYNRALAFAALGRTDRALRDYDAALQHEPDLADAALNRGVLHYQQERYPEALADLQRALDKGANPAAVHYNLALVHLARQDRDAARASVQRVLQHDPTHKEARELLARLQP
jgi:serine/threonine protein kinase/Tfp pilus assembly protein PilF